MIGSRRNKKIFEPDTAKSFIFNIARPYPSVASYIAAYLVLRGALKHGDAMLFVEPTSNKAKL